MQQQCCMGTVAKDSVFFLSVHYQFLGAQLWLLYFPWHGSSCNSSINSNSLFLSFLVFSCSFYNYYDVYYGKYSFCMFLPPVSAFSGSCLFCLLFPAIMMMMIRRRRRNTKKCSYMWVRRIPIPPRGGWSCIVLLLTLFFYCLSTYCTFSSISGYS